MSKKTTEDLVNALSELTVLEMAELKKLLEDKWGVKAAAPAVMAAAPAAGGAAPAAAAAVARAVAFAWQRSRRIHGDAGRHAT